MEREPVKRRFAYVGEASGESDPSDLRALGRAETAFVRDPPAPKSDSPDWHGAWTRFLDISGAPSTLYRNARAKGAWAALAFFLREWDACATDTVGMLVREADLPEEQRTVLPLDAPGLAGGCKFIRGGMFVKMAVDHVGMYGSDELASKSAAIELKHLGVLAEVLLSHRELQNGRIEVLPPRVDGVTLPFACTVTYWGRRFLASTLLPISGDTLCLGSADGGRTVRNTAPGVLERARAVGRALNLKEHDVGHNDRLPLAGDVEWHIGTDGRTYIVDVARLFPPFPPPSGQRQEILVRFFRAPVVASNPVPVSADAFSGFNKRSSRRVDDAEARALAERYFSEVLPAAAKHWDADPQLPFQAVRRAFGVNARHLGLVHRSCATAAARRAVEQEMIARVLKEREIALLTFRSNASPQARLRKARTMSELEACAAELKAPVLGEELRVKYGHELDVTRTVTVDMQRLSRNTGVTFNDSGQVIDVRPVVRHIPALVDVVDPATLRESLVRTERIGSPEADAAFRDGFRAVLRGTGVGTEASAEMFLEDQVRNWAAYT